MDTAPREQRTLLTACAAWASGALLVMSVAAELQWGSSAWPITGTILSIVCAQVSPWQPVVRSQAVRLVLVVGAVGTSMVVLARSFNDLVTELPSGYLPEAALVASVGFGLLFAGPFLLLVDRNPPSATMRRSSWQLLAGVPGLLVALSGGVLAQSLGWGVSPFLAAFLAVALSLGLVAGAASVAVAIRGGGSLGMPTWAYRTGLGINVIAGVLVGGNLLVIEYAFDGLLEPVDIVFASGSFVTALGALVLCTCAWLRRQRKVDEQEDQSE